MANPLVGIVMGSTSDWDTMKPAAKMLEEFGVSYEAKAMSAHRSPELVSEWAAGAAKRLGIYGFGAAAHLIAQVALAQGRTVFAFTRPGDADAQAFARRLGAQWAGGSDETPPAPLDAALIFAPAGPLVPAALAATVRGGTVICAGIHMSDIPAFPYRLLWGERSVRSVANLTRRDGEAFLALAATIPLSVHVQPFPLARANEALARLRAGAIAGAAVLTPGG